MAQAMLSAPGRRSMRQLAQGNIGIPVLVLYGDFIEPDARWTTIRRNNLAFADAVNKAGGKVEVIDLPKVGIRGNSHMVMMDKNSDEVAAYIQGWLERQGLFQ